ncbi:uncharacterized protein LOC126981971 [Eriocheir sinensis]|uniref:uncharacterized protein LOC126981971 n=1 Tax=Eriocheir sinensis TaxID=95602 RepID=UPI0021CAA137|nr:uncharacterized protein LOC126981971 [Eriocheir sinensis]
MSEPLETTSLDQTEAIPFNQTTSLDRKPHPTTTPITQHSTNILIHYHHSQPHMSPASSSSSSGPVPLPRSSIISSVVGQESSTHIVQSYGPVEEVTAGLPHSLPSSLAQPPLLHPSSSSFSSSSAHTNSSLTQQQPVTPTSSPSSSSTCNSTSLTPRQPPVTRSAACQTLSRQSKASQTNSRQPEKPQKDLQANERHIGESTGLAHSAAHWKLTNWGLLGEEAEWANSQDHRGSPSADCKAPAALGFESSPVLPPSSQHTRPHIPPPVPPPHTHIRGSGTGLFRPICGPGEWRGEECGSGGSGCEE